MELELSKSASVSTCFPVRRWCHCKDGLLQRHEDLCHTGRYQTVALPGVFPARIYRCVSPCIYTWCWVDRSMTALFLANSLLANIFGTHKLFIHCEEQDTTPEYWILAKVFQSPKSCEGPLWQCSLTTVSWWSEENKNGEIVAIQQKKAIFLLDFLLPGN